MRCSQGSYETLCRLFSIVHVELPVSIVDPFEYRRIETAYHTEQIAKVGVQVKKRFWVNRME